MGAAAWNDGWSFWVSRCEACLSQYGPGSCLGKSGACADFPNHIFENV